jgi:hypothetical protein
MLLASRGPRENNEEMNIYVVAITGSNDPIKITADSFGVSDSVLYFYDDKSKPVAVFTLATITGVVLASVITK